MRARLRALLDLRRRTWRLTGTPLVPLLPDLVCVIKGFNFKGPIALYFSNDRLCPSTVEDYRGLVASRAGREPARALYGGSPADTGGPRGQYQRGDAD